MRLIIVRHCEPDYENNTLTPRGWIEAKSLTKRLLKEKIDYVYVSPLGRAKDTAKEYLETTNKNYEILDWLKEFTYTLFDETAGKDTYPWDFSVEYFTSHETIYDNSSYMEIPFIKNSEIPVGYKYVTTSFDELLAKHGYVRKGKYYESVNSNKDTIVLFCHLGLECVLLSHLFNLPFVALAQHFAPAPSSVSIIYTEERKPGIVQFRAQSLGDLSHLYIDNIEPSFMARFRECHFDDTRKD